MDKGKLYKDMTTEEQLKYVTDLTSFVGEKLPRLEQLGDAWERVDRKDMDAGLRLLSAFQFAREFVEKTLRYGDYSARVRRLRVYIDKIKQEVAKGLTLQGANGHTYALVQATVPQRRRGRPTLQEQAAREQGVAVSPSMDAGMELQVKIARLMGVSVQIDATNAPRDLNNGELAEERRRKAEQEAKQNPSLFQEGSASSQADTVQTDAADGDGKTTAATPAADVTAGMVPQGMPDIPLPAMEEARLHLDQLKWLMPQDLQQRVGMVSGLRAEAASKAEFAKALAQQGAAPETIAPYAAEAQECVERYEQIYTDIDLALAEVFYRLKHDGDYLDRFRKRFSTKQPVDVEQVLKIVRPYYDKVKSPEFDLRMKTLIEQESPEFVARQKAEADRKKEVQDLLRYIRRTDKPLTKTRLTGMQNRMARLRELDPEEAKVQEPILRKAEEDFARMEAEKADGKTEKPSTDGKAEKADGKTDETAKEPSTDAKTDKN